MANPKEEQEDPPRKSSKLPLILGLTLALLGGSGGFYAMYSGLVFGGESKDEAKLAKASEPPAQIGQIPDVTYVPIDPMVISLGDGAQGRHLRFRAQLEVPGGREAEIQQLMPRVVDVLNSYLRALRVQDLTENTALMRLRAQMLRRVQIVTGVARVNDLMIMEFVLN